MEVHKRTIYKQNQSLALTLPAKEVADMNLQNGWNMMFWIGDNVIVAKPLLLIEGSKEGTWLRKINRTEAQTTVIIPPKIAAAFGIKAGDTMLVKAKIDEYGRPVFVMKPEKQNRQVRIKHDGDRSYVEVYALKPDGEVDESVKPQQVTVPYNVAHDMVAKIDTGEDPKLEEHLPKTDRFYLKVPKDFHIEFLEPGEEQPIRPWEADELRKIRAEFKDEK